MQKKPDSQSEPAILYGEDQDYSITNLSFISTLSACTRTT